MVGRSRTLWMCVAAISAAVAIVVTWTLTAGGPTNEAGTDGRRRAQTGSHREPGDPIARGNDDARVLARPRVSASHVTTAPPARESENEPFPEDAVVRVVDATGRAIYDAQLEPLAGGRPQFTQRNGEATFVAPRGESVAFRLLGLGRTGTVVAGSRAEVVLDGAIPVVISFRDRASGERVYASREMGSLGNWVGDTYRLTPGPVLPGEPYELDLTFRIDRGHAPRTLVVRRAGVADEDAESLHVWVDVPRETSVPVRARLEDGSVPQDCSIEVRVPGFDEFPAWAMLHLDGSVNVHGVPHVAEAAFTVHALDGAGRSATSTPVAMRGWDGSRRVELTLK